MKTTTANQEASLDKLTELLVRFRWLFVVPVLLPLSTLFNLLWGARNFYKRRLRSAPERHDARVHDIQEQIKLWHASGRKGRLCTARPAWMSISTRVVRYKHRDNAIAVELYDILHVDIDKRIARVEPRVTIVCMPYV